MDTFDREYHRLSNLGACDAVFGVEHTRVKSEWTAAGKPEDIEAFIRRRANSGPDGADAVPCVTMKLYRCKHTVEAMRWTDTDANREAFAAWFEKHDAMFETRGPLVCMPEGGTVSEGEWILYSDNAFIAMEDELFRDDYLEMPQ